MTAISSRIWKSTVELLLRLSNIYGGQTWTNLCANCSNYGNIILLTLNIQLEIYTDWFVAIEYITGEWGPASSTVFNYTGTLGSSSLINIVKKVQSLTSTYILQLQHHHAYYWWRTPLRSIVMPVHQWLQLLRLCEMHLLDRADASWCRHLLPAPAGPAGCCSCSSSPRFCPTARSTARSQSELLRWSCQW